MFFGSTRDVATDRAPPPLQDQAVARALSDSGRSDLALSFLEALAADRGEKDQRALSDRRNGLVSRRVYIHIYIDRSVYISLPIYLSMFTYVHMYI